MDGIALRLVGVEIVFLAVGMVLRVGYLCFCEVGLNTMTLFLKIVFRRCESIDSIHALCGPSHY